MPSPFRREFAIISLSSIPYFRAALNRFSKVLQGVNWIAIPELTAPLRVTARTRYHQTEQAATVYPAGEGQFRLEFDQPQRAPTPGQAVVLYQGDVVLGGGTIVAVE